MKHWLCREKTEIETNIFKNNKNLLYEFVEYNKNESWQTTNNIDCLWDCHSFFEPFGLPFKKVGDKIYMFGNFCCPECAATYNFEMNHDNNIWERYSLLIYLYNNNDPIFIANNKLLLKNLVVDIVLKNLES